MKRQDLLFGTRFDPNRMCLVMPKLTRMSGDVTFFRLPKDATAWTGF